MRFTDIGFTGQILPALKEKNGGKDSFEFWPDVILTLGLQERWRNAEIVILGIKFRRHLQRLFSVIEIGNGCGTQAFKCGPVRVSCFSWRLAPKVAHFEFTR